MFPTLEIESIFKQYMKGQLDIEGFAAVAQLTEQWLLGFEGAWDPAMAAIQSLCQQNSAEYSKRMLFALSLVLCAPSENTPRIFAAYKTQIKNEMPSVQEWISSMAMALGPHGVEVDVVKCLRHLEPSLLDIACDAYQISRMELLQDAVAWDDLDLFNISLPENADLVKHWFFSTLAKFEPAPESDIHRTLITTDDDEKEFFYYRVQEVRSRLFDEYAGGSNFKRPTGERRATLFPDGLHALERGTTASDQDFYRQPDFKERLMQDQERIVKSFFMHMNVGVGNENNDHHAAIITQAFLDAGISAAYIVEHGPCAHMQVRLPTDDGQEEPMSLKKALARFELMKVEGKDFYTRLYTLYLKDFSTEQVIDLCDTPESLVSAYQLTGNKAFLQAGNDKTRSLVMGLDLGL
ncbi:hypothetical protein IFT48_04045 [Pseudomonas fluorescens]|uniref:hypothetical protein n=1 Tax=Pseudomonas fluorescens TaxID=294 RepID=UPI001930C2FD|nr:hypothetical protein [Pseudomonas fluorescens]MBD8089143.1 hypothetical protein [Pseudomonas fluorescens]